MTEEKMKEIIREGKILECNFEERKQIFNFAFGSEYMNSDDKGTLKQYQE